MWFPAHWARVALHQLQHKEDEEQTAPSQDSSTESLCIKELEWEPETTRCWISKREAREVLTTVPKASITDGYDAIIDCIRRVSVSDPTRPRRQFSLSALFFHLMNVLGSPSFHLFR